MTDLRLDTQVYKLESEVKTLLRALLQGQTRVSSTAYDTAWTAQLVKHYPNEGFEKALEWLRRNQHDDGSWGSPVLHYHDRIVSTLSAILALYDTGNAQDTERIEAGERFIWQNFNRLHYDAHDTIGFPVVVNALVNHARNLGLDVPPYLFKDASKIEKKLNLLSADPNMWRYTTLHYSMEAVLQHLPENLSMDFADKIGCVGCSPSSTAATLMKEQTTLARSIGYLKNLLNVQGDGGVPTVDRIDVFELAWSLNHLRLIEWLTPDHPDVVPILEALWEIWDDEKGICFSQHFNVPDLDCTATAFQVLRWGGYPASADAFAYYETDTHFKCYDGELDWSMSAQIRALSAMQAAQDHPQYSRWSEKIIQILRVTDLQGELWFDKWHCSPYYLTAASVWLLHGVVDDLLSPRLNWLLKTQNSDGGWGFFGKSTIEETAYTLKALLFWDKHVERIEPQIITAGGDYLRSAVLHQEMVPMWIGKGLYTPYRVVKSSVIVAMENLREYETLYVK